MTTASAPRGSGPPVAIEVAVPDLTGRIGAVPQAITSSFSLTRTGVASPAPARSAERSEGEGGGSAGFAVEGALSPNNCGEHARGKDGTACRKA